MTYDKRPPCHKPYFMKRRIKYLFLFCKLKVFGGFYKLFIFYVFLQYIQNEVTVTLFTPNTGHPENHALYLKYRELTSRGFRTA